MGDMGEWSLSVSLSALSLSLSHYLSVYISLCFSVPVSLSLLARNQLQVMMSNIVESKFPDFLALLFLALNCVEGINSLLDPQSQVKCQHIQLPSLSGLLPTMFLSAFPVAHQPALPAEERI